MYQNCLSPTTYSVVATQHNETSQSGRAVVKILEKTVSANTLSLDQQNIGQKWAKERIERFNGATFIEIIYRPPFIPLAFWIDRR